jgi:2'-5' RNA ligase
MRAFIGIGLGSAEGECLGAASYIASIAGGKPVRKGNTHITLKFLGEIINIGGIARAMDAACKGRRPFYLQLGELSPAPRLRIAWCSVEGDLMPLLGLRQSIEDGAASVGYPREKRTFFPHITLVRGISRNWDAADVRFEQKLFIVNRLTLFESVRQNGELKYIPLHEANFGG